MFEFEKLIIEINSNIRCILFTLLLFISVLAPTTFAQYQTGPATEFQSIWQSSDFPWELLAIIAVFISFGYSALMFMLSRVFSSSDLEKASKYEFLYAVSSVVLVAFIILVIDVLASKSGQFVYLLSLNLNTPYANNLRTQLQNSGYSPFVVANSYIGNMSTLAIKNYEIAFCAALPLFTVNTLSIVKGADTKNIPTTVNKVSSFLNSGSVLSQISSAGINFILSSLQRAMSNLSYLIYILYFQKHLLAFIQSTMLTIFLPAGLVLRAFPFVRSVGNMLVSISIGLYFIYPITYSMFLIVGSQGSSQVGVVFESAADAHASISCLDTLVPKLIKIPIKLVFNSILAPFSNDISIAETINNQVNNLIGELIVMGFIFPFLAAVLTYTFIKMFGMILGADIQEFAEGLVKLI